MNKKTEIIVRREKNTIEKTRKTLDFFLTRNTFNRNFSNSFPVASQSWMDLPDLCLLPFNQLLQDLLLLPDDQAELGVDDLRVQLAPHQGRALVILDVSLK